MALLKIFGGKNKEEPKDGLEVKSFLVEKKLGKVKEDLTYALSQYEKTSEKKHEARGKYINELIASGGSIDDYIAEEMIETGEEDLLVSNLESCEGLTSRWGRYLLKRHVDSVLMHIYVKKLGTIKKGEKEPVYRNASTFNFDGVGGHERVVEYCIEDGNGDRVMCHINSFVINEGVQNLNGGLYNTTMSFGEPIFNVSDIEKIMRDLIKFDGRGSNGRWTQHLGELQEKYHGMIDPQIAFDLIKMDEEKARNVAKNLSVFKPDKKLVYELVEMGYGNEIKAEAISGFLGEEYKEVAKTLIDHGVKL